MGKALWLTAALAGLACQNANALDKPPNVYRCTSNGKTEYTEEPCLDAKKVDVTPTKGLETHKGANSKNIPYLKERTADMQREGIGKVLQQIDGQTWEQRETAQRRGTLNPAARQECKTLDSEIPRLEELEAAATPTTNRQKLAQELFAARKRYRELKC